MEEKAYESRGNSGTSLKRKVKPPRGGYEGRYDIRLEMPLQLGVGLRQPDKKEEFHRLLEEANNNGWVRRARALTAGAQ